jgi:hypothetical protein
VQPEGSAIINQTGFDGHRGGLKTAAGVATLGVGLLFSRPKDSMVVTYQKTLAQGGSRHNDTPLQGGTTIRSLLLK